MDVNENMKAVNQDARISKYMKGFMTQEEEQAFLADLKQDAELRSKAITLARMVRSMRKVGSEKDKALMVEIEELEGEQSIKTRLSSIIGMNATHGKTRKLFMSRKAVVSLSAAASILLCLWGSYRIYDNRQMAMLGTEYLACFPATDYVRGMDDGVQSKIAALYKSVESGKNIDATIEELEPMWRNSRKEEYNEYTEHSPQIGWMLANSYVIKNDKDKALKVLDVIIGDEDSTPALVDKAIELKKMIESRKLF